jgi:hypothetical protein
MSDLLNVCGSSYRVTLPACSSTLDFTLGLTPSTAYKATIVDKFDNRYTKDVESDAEGNISIDITADAATFTQFSGLFTLLIQTAEGASQPITVNAHQYDDVTFDLAATQPL